MPKGEGKQGEEEGREGGDWLWDGEGMIMMAGGVEKRGGTRGGGK